MNLKTFLIGTLGGVAGTTEQLKVKHGQNMKNIYRATLESIQGNLEATMAIAPYKEQMADPMLVHVLELDQMLHLSGPEHQQQASGITVRPVPLEALK